MPHFEISGVSLQISQEILSPALGELLNRGRYELQESKAIAHFVQPNDVVMEIGAGVGFISILAAKIVGGQNVIAIEANPRLLREINHNCALNNISGVSVLNLAVVAAPALPVARLYLNRAFWASSTIAGSNPKQKFVDVQAISLEALTTEWQPTVLVCDVEGSEKDYFKAPLPKSIRLIILEIHPEKYPPEVIDKILDRLAVIGFSYVFFEDREDVVCFERVDGTEK